LYIAIVTNVDLIKENELERAMGTLTYLRFNISAADKKRYCEIHGCKEKDYETVIDNIRSAVKIKKDQKLETTIGLQMVLMPHFADQVMPLSRLGKDLGVDYLVIKHCSDDENSSLGVDYSKYKDLIALLQEAEKTSTSTYQVSAKWSKILSGGKRNYSRCYGPAFIMQFSGSGLVAPCGMLFNDKYKEYHIGNIAEKSFKEIWKSDRYKEVLDLIASERFDAQTMCGTLCLQHKVNEYLNCLKEGKIKFEKPMEPMPRHINFI
jgi:MoaA/NifB/PqqE/SkfB family radical SAM enzyme